MRYSGDEKHNCIGVGVDLVEVERFRAMPLDTPFYRRVFTAAEFKYCCSFSDPYPHFAAIFAAKEAVAKALHSIQQLPLWDVEIRHDLDGAPIALVGALSSCKINLSMAHTKNHATAVAILTGESATKVLSLDKIVREILPTEASTHE